MKWLQRIYFNELNFEFVRSGGPGGQHVNRTNSAAILRWNLFGTVSFNDHEKDLLIKKLEGKISSAGDLIIRSQEFRDQEQNKRRCLEKLNEILEKAFFVQKKRKATKPTRSSREKRHKAKKQRSHIKKMRKSENWED